MRLGPTRLLPCARPAPPRARPAASPRTFLLLAALALASAASAAEGLLLGQPGGNVAFLENRNDQRTGWQPFVFLHLGAWGGNLDLDRPVRLSGDCRSAYAAEGGIVLVFPGSVQLFDLGKREARLLRRAPDGGAILAACGPPRALSLLADLPGGGLALQGPEGEAGRLGIAVPAGAPSPACSSANLMAVASAAGRDGFRLLVVERTAAGLRHDARELPGVPPAALQVHGDRLCLLSTDGGMLSLGAGGVLEPVALPAPSSAGGAWAAFSREGGSFLGVERTGDGHLLHAPWLPAPRRMEDGRAAEEKRVLKDVFTVPLVMLLGLLVLLYLSRRDAPPAPVPACPPRPAGLLLRVLAFWVDVFVVVQPVVLLASWLLLGKVGLDMDAARLDRYLADPELLWRLVPDFLRLALVQMAVVIAYQAAMERLFSASLGKMLFRLRVVADDGSRPAAGRTLARNLCRVLDFFLTLPLGLLSCAFSPANKSFGDRIAGTMVVEDQPPS